MALNCVKCIKIVHHPAEVRLHRTLSAFLRLIGIFACENLIGDEYGDDVDYICRIPQDSEKEPRLLKEQADNILSELKEFFDEEYFYIIDKIWNIFNENDLMRGCYAIDYFSITTEEYIYQQMEKALDRFNTALEQLRELEQNTESDTKDNIYLWMAEANCQRRINELTKILWNAIKSGKYGIEEENTDRLTALTQKYIKYEEIDNNISKVLKIDSQFYAAYAIRGFAKELAEDYKLDSVDDLKKATDLIGDKSYSSYLWFRIGRYYEKIRSDSPRKMVYYKKAVEVDRHNFRAIYKLAMYEQKKGERIKAIELWKTMLDVLQCKQNLPSLQPVECAYLYKAYRQLGLLYINRREYGVGIQYLKRAEEVYHGTKNENEETGFYPWMFGSDPIYTGSSEKGWEIYKKASREKLSIAETYAAIVDASSRADLKEIHDEYTKYLFLKQYV